MIGAMKRDAAVASYELEVEIAASPDRVWRALIDETNAWWLPDFHMVAEGSTVTFDARAGGALIERDEAGGSLLWYTVQWVRPAQRTVYLIGHVAPDWGGPAATHLKLAVEARGSGSVLKVSDAHHGHVDDENLASLHEGWTRLFGEGLRKFAEEG